ncbi:MAG: NADH:flavin oxidoreductase/NADH oxidase [Alphaproteobacteria bacterium]|nr:NADH:flavin oxidoreductase/NADH oxidase [Alphaproteobacteria bacterium]
MPSKLFSPITMRGLTLSNRIVVAPMCQYSAQDGTAQDWHLMHLGQLCTGGAGLVIAEATGVSPAGRISPQCLGLYSDANEAAIKRVIDFCQEHGTGQIGVQLGHAGRKASTGAPGTGRQAIGPDEADGWQTVAPSALPYAEDWNLPLALDDAGLAEVKAQFVAAAQRAARAGYALAELHAAHGYLLHQFLSPISNQRNDGYGGDLDGRMRFPLEVFAAVRAVWPEDRPLGVRVSATDWVDGGWTVEETVVFAREMKALGCDFMDVSSGGLDPRQDIPLGPGYQVHLAEQVRAEAEIPTMAVGMINDGHQAEAIVANGQSDMVALARGMLFDPHWAWHAAEDLGVEIPYPRQYLRSRPSLWPQAFTTRAAAE